MPGCRPWNESDAGERFAATDLGHHVHEFRCRFFPESTEGQPIALVIRFRLFELSQLQPRLQNQFPNLHRLGVDRENFEGTVTHRHPVSARGREFERSPPDRLDSDPEPRPLIRLPVFEPVRSVSQRKTFQKASEIAVEDELLVGTAAMCVEQFRRVAGEPAVSLDVAVGMREDEILIRS